jgi:hypothetical protein
MSYCFNSKCDHLYGGNISVVIQFKCSRCGKTHYEDPDLQKSAEHNLQCYRPPEGWTQTRDGHLFCTKCAEEYQRMLDVFMTF